MKATGTKGKEKTIAGLGLHGVDFDKNLWDIVAAISQKLSVTGGDLEGNCYEVE